MENSRLSIAQLGWGTVSGIVASLSVLISVVYDWGYFFGLDVSYSKSPITVVDHVQSWLAWLPALFSIGVGMFVAHLLGIKNPLENLDENATIEQLNSARKLLRRSRRLFILGLIVATVLLMIMSYVRYDSIYPLGFLFLPIFWIALIGRSKAKFSSAIGEILTWLPVALAFAFLWGSMHAMHALGKQGQLTHRIVAVDDGESLRVFDVKVLRVFQDWFLVVENDEQKVWISSATVKRMEVLNAP